MGYRLTKQESARRDDLVAQLRAQREVIEDAVSVANETIQAALDPVNKAIAGYNEILGAAKGFADDVASERRGEWDDKSEGWQQGERGELANGWIEEWENLSDAEVSEVTMPDVEIDDGMDHADDLEGLPEEAE